jgi:dihydrodipicolinate synthase/N-acetylneuraminate lyase
MSIALQGVLPVVQTPFTPTDDIDEEILIRELEWIRDQGVAGYTTGMVSELLRLSATERQQLAKVVVDVARSYGMTAIIGTGAESTKEALAHARHAESIGAHGVMVNPPVTVTLDGAGLKEYYTTILDGISIPVIVQDASGYIGAPIDIQFHSELLDTYGDRVYFKPEADPIGPRLSALRDATGGVARVFEGTGGLAMIDSFRRGIVGTMPGSEVCWAIQRMWQAAIDGDWDTAYAVSGPLSAMISMQTTIDVFVAVEKHLLVRQGVFTSAAVRGPSGFSLDDETRDEVDRLFDRIAEAVKR